MTLWRTLVLIAFIVLVLIILLLIFEGFLKNRYFHEFKKDELLKKTKSINSKNLIFFTSGETRKYIKRYVLCRSAYDKYIICDYNDKYYEISFYVILYNWRNKPIAVYDITEKNTEKTSKIISVSNNCKFVNVVVKRVNDLEINTNVIKPLSIRKIQLYSLFQSLAIFLGLFIANELIVEIFGGVFKQSYLNSIYNHLFIIAIGVIALINWVVTAKALRKRNCKYTNGGSLEYEFF